MACASFYLLLHGFAWLFGCFCLLVLASTCLCLSLLAFACFGLLLLAFACFCCFCLLLLAFACFCLLAPSHVCLLAGRLGCSGLGCLLGCLLACWLACLLAYDRPCAGLVFACCFSFISLGFLCLSLPVCGPILFRALAPKRGIFLGSRKNLWWLLLCHTLPRNGKIPFGSGKDMFSKPKIFRMRKKIPETKKNIVGKRARETEK